MSGIVNSTGARSGIIGTTVGAPVIDSDQYVDASIDSAHIGNDQIDSQHYAAGSIDLEHMSSQSVDEDNLHVSNGPTDGYVLTARSSAAGDMTWEAAATGLSTEVGEYDATISTTGSTDLADPGDRLQYTKYGRVVFVHGALVFTDSTASGTPSVSLPFTARNVDDELTDIYSGGVGSYNAYFGSRTQLIYKINGGNATMQIYGSGDNTTYAAATPDANTEWFFSVTYLTDA